MFAVTATKTRRTADGTVSTQVPSFTVHNCLTERSAYRKAAEILGCDELGVSLHDGSHFDIACADLGDGDDAEELSASLRKVVRALETHLTDEAAREGVPVEKLCPCTEEELAEAKAILAS